MRLAILTLTMLLIACQHEEKAPQPAPAKPTPAPQIRFKLSGLEEKVFHALLIEDIKTFAEGGDALAASSNSLPLPKPVKAESLQTVYEGNEVLGDKMFRHKTLSVSGAVASIDRSVGENYFVSLHGGSNVFAKPHASMADGFTDYLAALKKGQKITLVCVGDGMLLGSAILKECEPVETWAEKVANEYIPSLQEIIVKKDSTAAMLLLITVAISSQSNRISECFGKDDAVIPKCMEKAAKRLDSASYASAFEKIKTAGLDLKKELSK